MENEKTELKVKGIIAENDPNSEENLSKLEELRKLYLKHYNFDNADSFADLADELKGLYPDEYQTYRLYHLIAGSSPNPSLNIKINKFDFPNNEVQLFLERLEGEEAKESEVA